MDRAFALPTNSDFQLEIKTALTLCEAVDTPRSLAVYLLLVNEEWQQYVDLSIDPSHYENPSNFADDLLVTKVLEKSPLLPLDVDRKEEALSSFWTSELACFYTNERLRTETFDFERQMRKTIADILGPLDRHALERIEQGFRHGPGATASMRSRGLVPSDKFDQTMCLTVELVPFFKSIVGESWHSHLDQTKDVIYGNKFTTVPKNAKTDRGICAEPTLNMYVQLGIGAYIRDRLRRFGVDLNDQSCNQDLAQRAWKDGLCTIDLSAASDSLSTELVLSYLPEPWVELLSLCRSHRCFVDGEWHELEKFSSMGNGYTFELESLIFYALCRSIVPRDRRDDVGVYGDDLIIPVEYSQILINALNFLGFRVNTRKSFLAGSFYESCGADFFKGRKVRPFFLKGNTGRTPYSLRIANRLRSYARMRCEDLCCDSRFRPLWVSLFLATPREWRKCKVPEEFGDVGFVVSFEEAKPRRHVDYQQGWTVRTIAFSAVNRTKNTFGVLLSALSHAGPSEAATYGREPKRGFLGRPRPKKAYVSHWPDGFLWCD